MTRISQVFAWLSIFLFSGVLAAQTKTIVIDKCTVEKVAGGFKFTEGPAWSIQGSGYLVFSDLRADLLYSYEPGKVNVIRKPGRGVNGNAFNDKGELISCERQPPRISLTGKKGENLTLAYEYEGAPLKAPNDLALKSDGTIWFTDPGANRKKDEDTNTVHTNHVYRIEKSGKLVSVITEIERPNGICFSPDEKKLYVADSGKAHDIRVYQIGEGNKVSGGESFSTIPNGIPDGIKCDRYGHVFSSGGEGVYVYGPGGNFIGLIKTKESPANLAFGPNQSLLFVTARTSLYMIKIVRQ